MWADAEQSLRLTKAFIKERLWNIKRSFRCNWCSSKPTKGYTTRCVLSCIRTTKQLILFTLLLTSSVLKLLLLSHPSLKTTQCNQYYSWRRQTDLMLMLSHSASKISPWRSPFQNENNELAITWCSNHIFSNKYVKLLPYFHAQITVTLSGLVRIDVAFQAWYISFSVLEY